MKYIARTPLKQILLRLALLFSVIVGSFILSALSAHAQGTAAPGGFVPLAQSGDSVLQSAYQNSTSLAAYFNEVFKLALSAGAILAVLRLGYAGYLYMVKDSFSQKQDAKGIFSDAILGLLILFSVYLILYQINPCILQLNALQAFNSTNQTTACKQGQGP